MANNQLLTERGRQRRSVAIFIGVLTLLATSCASVVDETNSPMVYRPPTNEQTFAVQVMSDSPVTSVEITVPGIGTDVMVHVGGGRYEAKMLVPKCANVVEFTVKVRAPSAKIFPSAGAFTHEVTNLPPECVDTATGAALPFDVNSFDDFEDESPGDGVCSGGPRFENRCSLRAAVMESNAKPGSDLIKLRAGRYTLSLTGDEAGLGIDDTVGDLDITDSVTIQGQVSESVSAWDFLVESNERRLDLTDDPDKDTSFVKIDGGQIDRVFQVQTGATLRLLRLAVVNGSSNDEGGGIHNAGETTLERVAVIGNRMTRPTAARQGGGGIWNGGLVVIDQSVIAQNVVGGSVINPTGGAVLNKGTAEITRTLVAYNSARFGNALHNEELSSASEAKMTLTNVTVHDHLWGTSDPASVISNRGNATLDARYLTVSRHSIGSRNLLTNNTGEFSLANSLFVDNRATACSGAIVSGGGNVIEGPCTLSGSLTALDHIDVTPVPVWGWLKDEGGFSPVFPFSPPFAESSLFDATDRTAFGGAFTDQRGEGFARSIDGNGDGDSKSDPGAYEYQP